METFNILKKNSSPQIEEKIKPRERSNYHMRSFKKGNLNVIEKPKKSCMGFTYISAKVWNLLPEEIRLEEKAKPFKSKIKEWIGTNIPD